MRDKENYVEILESLDVQSEPDGEGTLKIIRDESEIDTWTAVRRAELASDGLPVEWADIGIVLDDPYIIAMRDLVEFPDGARRGYLRLVNRAELRGGQATVILPRLGSKFLLLKHFRHATGRFHIEAPRGFGEAGISAEQNARKEVAEETGASTAALVDLGMVHTNTGMDSLGVQVYLATLENVGEPEVAEGISAFYWVDLPRLEEMIASGEITDSFTITAYTRAKLRGLLD